MMLKKVHLVVMPDDSLRLIPIDSFNYDDVHHSGHECKIISDKDYGFWIFKRTIEGGAHDGLGNLDHVEDITQEHVESILKNDGKCYVEVDDFNFLRIPSNGHGKRRVVIHLN